VKYTCTYVLFAGFVCNGGVNMLGGILVGEFGWFSPVKP